MTEKNHSLITLKKPIKRGEQEITELTLRKPNTGALRGCRLSMLLNSDVDSLITVLPRITEPALTEQDIADMDVKDLVSCAGEVVGFLTE
ncbi:phage tail assembly protein [Spongiibacter taiwanensis]|uniref:phage tail assembly protein n=1 Tax=Spongiibacter taiwanensis TaxID=1748242 RepID=UPI002034BD51|nr:phage tail assembly protein [Spongiibacter taiwanensis]USA43341.1 phage tail assembly protein [Spongiibacter taiwanensis]